MRSAYFLNLAGLSSLVLISIVVVAIFIVSGGVDRFGAFLTFGLIASFVSLFDLGLTRAVMAAIASQRTSTVTDDSALVWTGFVLAALSSTIGGGLLAVAGTLLIDVYAPPSSQLRAEILRTLPWAGLIIPLNAMTAVLLGYLEASKRFLHVNVAQVSNTVFGNVAAIVAALAGYTHLDSLMSATCVVRFVMLCIVIFALLAWNELKPPAAFRLQGAQKLLSYGAWISFSNILTPILSAADQLFVGYLMGAAASGHYGMAMKLVSPVLISATSLSRALFPALALDSGDDALRLAHRAQHVMAAISMVLCAPALFLVGPFLRMWLGEAFSVAATPAALIFFVGSWFNALAFIPVTLMQSQGRPDEIARIHGLQVAPFLLGTYFLVQQFGLVGGAVAWSARCVLDFFMQSHQTGMRMFSDLILWRYTAFVLVVFCVAWLVTLPAFAAAMMSAITLVSAIALAAVYDDDLRAIAAGVRTRLLK